MKILYIITQSELGGAQKNATDLAAAFKARENEVLIGAGRDGNGDLFKILTENQIPFVCLDHLRRAANSWTDLRALLEIRRLIKKEKPDIIHLHSSKAGVLGSLAAIGQKSKVVYTVHGAVFTAAFSWPSRQFFLWLEKITGFLKDRIICVSENDKKLWLQHKVAPEKKLTVIYNGINPDQTLLPKDQAREKMLGQSAALFEAVRGLNPDLKLVGCVANFYPEKGLPFFIKAAAILRRSHEFKNVIFTVIGEGAQRKFLEAMIKEYGLEKKFILPGRIPNFAQMLKAFDVFVLPSIKEGFPYAILEAMAADLPIVATYVGGVPEIIKNGENGFLVLPKNPEMLARRIAEILRDPSTENKFKENSRARLTEFSLDQMVDETNKVYQD